MAIADYIGTEHYDELKTELRSELSKAFLANPDIQEYNRQMDYYSEIKNKLHELPLMDNYGRE